MKTDVILDDQADIEKHEKTRYVSRSKRQLEYIQPMQKGFGTLESIPYESLPMLRRNGLREMTINPHDNPSEIINRYNAKSIQEALFNDVPPVQQYSQSDYNFPSHSHNIHPHTNIHPHIPQRHIPINQNATESEEFMKFLNGTLSYSPLKVFKEFIVSLNSKLSACCEKCRVDIFKVFENSTDFSVANVTTESPPDKVKCDVMDFLQQLFEAGKISTTPLPTTTSTTTETPPVVSRDTIKPALVDLLHHLYAFSKTANIADSFVDDSEEEECIEELCETTITPPVKKHLKMKKKFIQ